MRDTQALEKCKPIFAGHDQQDAQEFLSEMLDSLHEDVNRVVRKPYIAAPEDAVWDAMSCEVLALYT
jgi:ubiquitin C-terminal hydrolase